MMDGLAREIILDHVKRPRNKRTIDAPTGAASQRNPVCGDIVRIQVVVADDRITDVAYTGQGCAVSQSSASILTDAVRGKTTAEAHSLIAQMEDLTRGGPVPEGEGLDELVAFETISKVPGRITCCLLGWRSLDEAMNGATETH